MARLFYVYGRQRIATPGRTLKAWFAATIRTCGTTAKCVERLIATSTPAITPAPYEVEPNSSSNRVIGPSTGRPNTGGGPIVGGNVGAARMYRSVASSRW